MIHLSTNIILLGLQKAFDVTLNFKYRGPFLEPLCMNIEGHEVSTSIHWMPLTVMYILAAFSLCNKVN